jgi:hypothetical protein
MSIAAIDAGNSLASLDKHITDLGGLISLALALVTVFTTVRSTRAATRKGETGLTRDDMIGELILDSFLIALTAGVILAAAPLFVGAVGHLAIGHQSGSLRLIFAIVWVLLIALAAWQTTILKSTIKSTKKAWGRRRTG